MSRRSNSTSHTSTKAAPAPSAIKSPSPTRPRKMAAAPTTKAETLIQLLRHKDGATLAQMTKATGWQGHSVRGFLSGAIKKKRGLAVLTERVDGALRYRLGKGA
jgi:hypothetical protein